MILFFLGWSGKDLGMMDAVAALRGAGHTIAYWSGADFTGAFSADEWKGTILHEHSAALRGVPAAGLEDLAHKAPDIELIREFFDAETEVLTMMNKLFEGTQTSERKQKYYSLLAYWSAVFDRLGPDAVIFPTIPHTVYDFIAYRIAQKRGVKTVMFEPTWVGDRLVGMLDFKDGSEALSTAVAGCRGALSELPADLQREYRAQTGKGDATPVFVTNIKKRYRGVGLLRIKLIAILRSVLDLSFFEKAVSAITRRLGDNLVKEYIAVEQNPDFTAPYLYVPLHYQPERNSSPQGGLFVDQVLLLKLLAAELPKDVKLYVKEHPTEWLYRGNQYFSYRYKGFYREIAAIPNVSIVPAHTNSYTLIQHAAAVVTITGTAGWEALFRGKPVIAFGYPWYRDCPGVFLVHNRTAVLEALRKIFAGTRPSSEDVVSYLLAFGKGTFHGYIDSDGKKVSALSPKENGAVLADEIKKLLRVS